MLGDTPLPRADTSTRYRWGRSVMVPGGLPYINPFRERVAGWRLLHIV